MKKKRPYEGNVDDAFLRIRSRFNNIIANFLPDAWEKLNSAFNLLDSENREKWSNAVHSCRRILENLVDFVYPPSEDRIFEGSNKPTKLGKDEYINRIMAFVEDSKMSSTFTMFIGSNINFFWNRLSSIYQASNKGSHEVIHDQEEADRYVVNTYLIVGDILSLWYSKTKPENLIEGLANTIFYEFETETIMYLYYQSKISPYELVLKPDYPLGTGTKFLIFFKKNNLVLDQAFDLRYLLPEEMNNFFHDESGKGEYLQIGTHYFKKNKDPFLIVALGGVGSLKIAIFEYIQPKLVADINEKNWKIVGKFSGQSIAYIEDNKIYLPYGSHGLGDTYQFRNGEFVEKM